MEPHLVHGAPSPGFLAKPSPSLSLRFFLFLKLNSKGQLPASERRTAPWEKSENSQGPALPAAPPHRVPGAALRPAQRPSNFENEEGLGP